MNFTYAKYVYINVMTCVKTCVPWLCRAVVRAVVAGASLNLPYSSDAAKMLVKDTNLLAQAMSVDPPASIGVITALHSACHVSVSVATA